MIKKVKLQQEPRVIVSARRALLVLFRCPSEVGHGTLVADRQGAGLVSGEELLQTRSPEQS
jgi:hypothetical protein